MRDEQSGSSGRGIFATVRDYLKKARNLWGDVSRMLAPRRDRGPIDSVSALCDFVSTRSAFIAQKTLYGYLKTRMGTRYPSVFEDNVFSTSIKLATQHVFAACLSDLTIFAVAKATEGHSMDDGERVKFAQRCYEAGMAANAEAAPIQFAPRDCIHAFAARLRDTDWGFGALRRENFTRSPAALVHWAPIAPELKDHDEQIVHNSIRFAWREIRVDFDSRLEAESILTDWSIQTGLTQAKASDEQSTLNEQNDVSKSAG